MGKYTALRGKIPQLVDQTPWQEKVDKEKKRLTAAGVADTLQNLGRYYQQTKFKKDECEAELDKVKLLSAAAEQLLIEKLTEAGIDKFTLANGGGTLSINPDPHPSIKDSAALIRWLKENHKEELLTLNWQTLRGIVTERLMNAEPLPDGVEVFLQEKVHRSGGQKGGASEGNQDEIDY